MRIAALIVVVWLVIGLVAAVQRGYLIHRTAGCTTVATVAVTVIAGPANYVGANPRVTCTVPQPSK